MNDQRDVERCLREWLSSHHSVIGQTEAKRLGASKARVKGKLTRGEWDRLYHGVYRDAAAPTGPWQTLRAAYVALGGWGVVSHASAAWAWGLLDDPPTTPELTVRQGVQRGRGHSGIAVHQSRDFDTAKNANRNAIVLTNPLRTLVDLASIPAHDLTHAVDAALAGKLITVSGLLAEIDRLAQRGRKGVAQLRDHLNGRGFLGAPAPSVLEAHLRRIVVSLGLPMPRVEVRTGPGGAYRLDIAWPELRFAVEVDGYAWHFSPEQMRHDLTRRNRLQQQGWTVLVFTWHQVVNEPDQVARDIAATFHQLARLDNHGH